VLRETPPTRRQPAGVRPPRRATSLDLRRDARPPARPDLRRGHAGLAAAYWAASQLNLPALAEAGHEGAGGGIYTPVKHPADGHRLHADNRAYNRLLRAQRAPDEHGFALLKGRWKVLRHITTGTTTITEARVLTAFYTTANQFLAEITSTGLISATYWPD
jgi:hypothetical protein